MESVRSKKTGAIALAAVWEVGLPAESCYQSGKRAFDVIISTVAFLAVLPLLLVACALILIDFNCFPIYKQKRVGINGEVFVMYKLRTMIPGSEAFSFTSSDDDWRVTWLGRILRSTKIDELPQLINIIRGQMSIIGPRPLSLTEIDHLRSTGWDDNYPGFIPTVSPGLIGLEQLSRTKPMDYRQRFALNHEYEMNQSAELDADIFVRAIWICRPVCLATAIAGLSEAVFVYWLNG